MQNEKKQNGQTSPAEALRALKPQTTSARLRDVLPLIDERLRAGFRYEEILDTLTKAGMAVNLNTLKSNVQRYRKKQNPVAPASAVPIIPATQVDTHSLSRFMRPDAAEESVDLLRYEQLGKQKAFQKQQNRQDDTL